MRSERTATRRPYGADAKARVLAECDEPGASVAKVAMAHGINANVVHRWRQLAREGSLKPDGGKSENVTKVTIGPTLSTGPDFWRRPELRLYVTYADYNKAAAADSANNYNFPANKTTAVSYGAQFEIWF